MPMGNLIMPVIGPFEAKFTGGICMTCDQPIVSGEKVMWLKGQGMWHADCKTPTSISMYVAEEVKKRKRES